MYKIQPQAVVNGNKEMVDSINYQNGRIKSVTTATGEYEYFRLISPDDPMFQKNINKRKTDDANSNLNHGKMSGRFIFFDGFDISDVLYHEDDIPLIIRGSEINDFLTRFKSVGVDATSILVPGQGSCPQDIYYIGLS